MSIELGEITLIDTEELEAIKGAVQYYKKQYKLCKAEIARLNERIHLHENSREDAE